VDHRCAPGRQFIALGQPHPFAVLEVESSDKRILLNVTLDDNQALVDGGRTRIAPGQFRLTRVTGIEYAEILLPEKLAVHVITIESFGTECGHNDTSISCRRRVCLSGLDVPFDLRHPLIGSLRPDNLAGALTETVHEPLMH